MLGSCGGREGSTAKPPELPRGERLRGAAGHTWRNSFDSERAVPDMEASFLKRRKSDWYVTEATTSVSG